MDEAFYRHCRRLKVMTHVDNPWLPESERKIVEEEPWRKTKKSPDKVSSCGGNSRMAERLIANTLMYSPSLRLIKRPQGVHPYCI